MLNVYELESRWRKYKIKSYIPYLIIGISVVVILIILFIFYTSKSSSEKSITNKENKQNIIVIKKEYKQKVKSTEDNKSKKELITHIETPVIQQETQEKKLILSPSLGFMSNMKHNTVPYYENETIYKKVPTPKTISKPKVKKHIVENKPIEEIILPIQDNNIIKIQKQNTRDDIAHVIKRFKKNNNPALSLFVAKKYYELGEYHKSYNYALITNELNDNIEASWIIFAKSLFKLNEKDEAVKTLKSYIKHSHSNQAKILLEEITSGKFK